MKISIRRAMTQLLERFTRPPQPPPPQTPAAERPPEPRAANLPVGCGPGLADPGYPPIDLHPFRGPWRPYGPYGLGPHGFPL